MALRSLGNTLVAKNAPGARLRDTETSRIQNPQIPGKGVQGTLSRAQTQEPLERAVPGGSEKVVASQPTVEGTSVPTDRITPPMMDFESAVPEAAAPSVTGRANPGGNAQALFQGGVSTPGQPAQATGVPVSRVQSGRAGTTTSRAGNAPGVVTQPKVAAPSVLGISTQATASQPTRVQGQQSPQVSRTSILPAVGNTIANKAYAENPKQQTQSYVPTTGQYLAGQAGQIASRLGSTLNSNQLRSIGNQLQSFGGQPTKTPTGQKIQQPGSVSRTVTNVVNNLRSQAGNAVNALRSGIGKLFGR